MKTFGEKVTIRWFLWSLIFDDSWQSSKISCPLISKSKADVSRFIDCPEVEHSEILERAMFEAVGLVLTLEVFT